MVKKDGPKLFILLVLVWLVLLSGFMFYSLGQWEKNRPANIIITGLVETPTPIIPPVQQATIGIGSSWAYVLRYQGTGKGQTPVFVADHKWIVHWQCYLPGGAGHFPINVYQVNGLAAQPANIWDCRKGHTSGDSPVYQKGDYFVGVSPGSRTANWDVLIEVYA